MQKVNCRCNSQSCSLVQINMAANLLRTPNETSNLAHISTLPSKYPMSLRRFTSHSLLVTTAKEFRKLPCLARGGGKKSCSNNTLNEDDWDGLLPFSMGKNTSALLACHAIHASTLVRTFCTEVVRSCHCAETSVAEVSRTERLHSTCAIRVLETRC